MMTAAMALMLVGLFLTATPSLVVSIAAIAIFTAGFFGAHSIASGWVSDRAATARAAAASLYLFAYYSGSSLFGSLGGVFWSRYGWPGIMALVTVLIGAALATASRLSAREAQELKADR